MRWNAFLSVVMLGVTGQIIHLAYLLFGCLGHPRGREIELNDFVEDHDFTAI